MSEDKDFILTDEYNEYTEMVGKIYREKKTRQDDMRKLYDTFKTEMAELDKKAAILYDNWEKFKAEQMDAKKPATQSPPKEAKAK